MGAELIINGVDRTLKADFRTYQVVDSLSVRGDSFSFEMVISSAESAVRPLTGQPVVLKFDGETIFDGDISGVEETKMLNSDYFLYNVTCSDFTRRLDRYLVVIQEIGPAAAGDIIKAVLADFAPEFAIDFSGIQTGPSVGKQQYDYVPVTSVLDQLAQETQMIWYMDESRRIVFTDHIEFAAPIEVYDVDTEVQLGDITWSESVDQIKNRIYLKDASVKDSNSRTDKIPIDGQTSFVKLFSEPFDETTTSVTTVNKAGESKIWQTVVDPGDSAEDTLQGDENTAYVCILNWGIRFPLNAIPEEGFAEVTYNPTRADVVYMVEDPSSQLMMRYREGGASSGVYEHMVSVPDVRVDSESPIEAYGYILLERIAWPEITGTFKSFQVTSWKAGQTFWLASGKRDLYDQKAYWQTGQTSKENIQAWVQSVQKKIVTFGTGGTVVLEATIEFSNNIFGRV